MPSKPPAHRREAQNPGAGRTDFDEQKLPRLKPGTQKGSTRIIDTHHLPELRHDRLENMDADRFQGITDKLVKTPSEGYVCRNGPDRMPGSRPMVRASTGGMA